MAIYHFSAKVIARSAGRSAVAAAAYRSASRLYDERTERPCDYTRKSGVLHSEIMAPAHAPDRWQDRQALWNEVVGREAQGRPVGPRDRVRPAQRDQPGRRH